MSEVDVEVAWSVVIREFGSAVGVDVPVEAVDVM